MIVIMSARMDEKMVARTNTRCKVATSSGAGSGLASLSGVTKSEAKTASPVGSSFLSSYSMLSPVCCTSIVPSFGVSESLSAIARVDFQS